MIDPVTMGIGGLFTIGSMLVGGRRVPVDIPDMSNLDRLSALGYDMMDINSSRNRSLYGWLLTQAMSAGQQQARLAQEQLAASGINSAGSGILAQHARSEMARANDAGLGRLYDLVSRNTGIGANLISNAEVTRSNILADVSRLKTEERAARQQFLSNSLGALGGMFMSYGLQNHLADKAHAQALALADKYKQANSFVDDTWKRMFYSIFGNRYGYGMGMGGNTTAPYYPGYHSWQVTPPMNTW